MTVPPRLEKANPWSQQVGDWRNLEDLNVRHNELRFLPLEMKNWTKLKRVFAGGNVISDLPAEVKTKNCSQKVRFDCITKFGIDAYQATCDVIGLLTGNR